MFRSSRKGERSSKTSGSGSTRRSTKRPCRGSAESPSKADDSATPQTLVGEAEQQNTLIPSGLSFVFRIDPLEPDFSVQGRLGYPRLGFWQPPTVSNAFQRTQGSLYRWRDGRIGLADDIPATTVLSTFRTATLFSQEPDTPHLLAVEYDATAENVSGNLKGEWEPLSFRQNRGYSYVDVHGDSRQLPFPASGTWMPQLLPLCNNTSDTSFAVAGLIGKLPLLMALVAFSCTAPWLDYVLRNHVFPGIWYPHGRELGRSLDRGMVVSTFYDPTSTFQPPLRYQQCLVNLEDGEYGPMFAP